MTEVNFSLGWELEVRRGVGGSLPEGVHAGSDASVSGEGIEYRLRERYVDDPIEGMRQLRALVVDRRIQTDETCGFHVHLGIARNQARPIPSGAPGRWAAWYVTLAKQVEDAAFEAVPASRRDNQFCRRWSGVRVPEGVIKQEYSRYKGENRHRYQWVNMVEMFRPQGIRTVEIRLMGEVKRFVWLHSWVSACILMGRAAWRLMDDPSRLDVEADQVRAKFGQIRESFLRRRTFDATAATAHRLGIESGLIAQEFSRVRDFFALEASLRNVWTCNERMRRAYHRERIDEETGESYRPRSPISNCLCDECHAARERRRERQRQREQEAISAAVRDLAADRERRQRIGEAARMASEAAAIEGFAVSNAYAALDTNQEVAF